MPDAMPRFQSDPLEPVVLDDRWRGVPPGGTVAAADIGGRGWHPADGRMSLLTLDETAFLSNRDLFKRYVGEQGAFVALEGDPDCRVGDVVEFGASHPCTTFDRHGLIYVLGPNGRVRLACRTWFG